MINKEIPLTLIGFGFLAFPFGFFALIPSLCSFSLAFYYKIKKDEENLVKQH